jgi:copper transport protein
MSSVRPVAPLRMIGAALAAVVLASVGVVVITGLYSAGRQVESVSDLVRTGYGWAVVIKAGLLVVLLVLGALNAIRLHGWRIPGRGPSMTRRARTMSTRLIAVEAAVGAGLLVVVGVLTESAPPREEANPVASVSTEAGGWIVERVGAASVGDLLISVSATPNRPGLNAFTVMAVSSRRPVLR